MQDEHFMKLWVAAHAFPAVSGTATDVLGSRFDMLRERVGTIGKTHEEHAPAPAPLPGARARLARLFVRAIPAGVLAGIAAAAIAGAAGSGPAPVARSAQADIARFDLPYLA